MGDGSGDASGQALQAVENARGLSEGSSAHRDYGKVTIGAICTNETKLAADGPAFPHQQAPNVPRSPDNVGINFPDPVTKPKT